MPNSPKNLVQQEIPTIAFMFCIVREDRGKIKLKSVSILQSAGL
jgi:hypothetical protein